MSAVKTTILIVDDTPTNIQLLNSMLREQYKVKAATNGAKALKIARTEPQPDIILLDIMMPEMDGYEVCSTQRIYRLFLALCEIQWVIEFQLTA